MTKRKDPFKIFNVEPGKYTNDTLKAAYLELIKRYTPEKSPEKFEEIRSAYSTLKNAKSPYDILSIAPLKMSNTSSSKESILNKLEIQLGIEKKKIEYKRALLLKQLEDTTNDTGN